MIVWYGHAQHPVLGQIPPPKTVLQIGGLIASDPRRYRSLSPRAAHLRLRKAPSGRHGLIVLIARLRDSCEGFAHIRFLSGKIAERDNADETLIAVHYRQSVHLEISHILGDMPGILILEAVFDLTRHRIADFAVRSFAIANPADCNVTIADHANEMVALADRQDAAIAFCHQSGRVLDRIVGIDQLRVTGHYVSNLHFATLLDGFSRQFESRRVRLSNCLPILL
jgi:hypothetical protein